MKHAHLWWSLLLLGACVPEVQRRVELYPVTSAPPARALRLTSRDDKHAVVVDAGVAFAVSVVDNCPSTGAAAATPPTLTIADPTVLESRGLSRSPGQREWVLFAKKSGRTTIELVAPCAKQSYEVEVTTPIGAPQH